MRIQGQTFDHVLRPDAPFAHCWEEARPYTARYSSYDRKCTIQALKAGGVFITLQMFADKETLLNALATSHDVHVQHVDAREELMTDSVRRWLTTVVEELHDRHEHRRNRARVTEINHLIDHLRDDVDNIDMMID